MAYSQQNNPFMKRGTSYSPLKDNGDEKEKRTPGQIKRLARRKNRKRGKMPRKNISKAEQQKKRKHFWQGAFSLASIVGGIVASQFDD